MSTNNAAAIYCRISSDPTGQGAGVERQREDCEALAATLGLTVVETLVDNDVSAYTGVTRPGFEALLAGAAAGDYGHVIIWHPDRLYRRLVDLVRITDQLRNTAIHTCITGDVDLTTATGRLNAHTLGGIGQYESEHKAERIARRARQRAANGVMTSATRPRGWKWADPCPGDENCRHRTRCEPGQRARIGSRAGLVLDEVEAPVVAQVFRDVAEGVTLTAAAKRAARAGVQMSQATSWRGVLLNPRNAGLVSHRGVIVAEAADQLALIDRDTFDKVGAILRDPSRRTAPGRPANTLLGGVIRCRRCGGPMAAGRKASGHGDHTKTPTYVCSREQHMSVRRHRVDGPVLDTVGAALIALADAGALLLPTTTDDAAATLRADIAAAEDKLGDLAGLVAAGDLDPADYAAATRRIREQLAGLTARLTKRVGRPALGALAADPAGIPAAWTAIRAEAEAGNVARLRAVLREVLESVTPTEDGITLVWRIPGPLPTVIERAAVNSQAIAERQESVARAWGDGLRTITAIAEHLGLARGTVRHDLSDLGLRHIPPRGAPRPPKPAPLPPLAKVNLAGDEARAWAVEKCSEGYARAEVARAVGVYRGTVLDWCRDAGIAPARRPKVA